MVKCESVTNREVTDNQLLIEKKLNSCELKTSYLCVFLQRCVYSVLIAGLVSPSDRYKISLGDVFQFIRVVNR